MHPAVLYRVEFQLLLMEGNVQTLLAFSTLLLLAQTSGVCSFDNHLAVCSQNVFNAECNKGQYIYILKAWYGRKKGRCVDHLHDDQECGCDVTDRLRRLCDGRSNCTKGVLDKHLPCKSTCNPDLTQHLYVSVGCVGQWSKDSRVVTCSQEQFKVECNEGQYVYIVSAWLGRRDNRCVQSIKEECGCDVTSDIRNLCANRTQCSKDVLKKYFTCNSTCSTSLKHHLHVTYACRGTLLRIMPHLHLDKNSSLYGHVRASGDTDTPLEPPDSGATTDRHTGIPMSQLIGIIVGIVVGVIVIILIAVGCYCAKKKRQSKKDPRSSHEGDYKTVPEKEVNEVTGTQDELADLES